MANRLFLLAFVLIVSLATAGPGGADEYYKGKTIHFIVGLSPGGGFDTYTRLIARHIGKHIPGSPLTVVENMTGAGGLISANHLYNKAKPDGLSVGTYPGPIILRHVLGYKGVLLDGRKLGWVVALTPAAQACAFTKASGIRSAEDWLGAKRPVKLGGLAPGDDTVDVPKILKVTTNFPIQVVEGYKGVSNVRLAAESGEVDGVCFNWYGMKGTWGARIDSGDVRVVLQNVLGPHPDLKEVPLATRYARNDEARQLLQAGLRAYGVPMYIYTVPPGTPKERLDTLRKAFSDTLSDPALLEEARKAKLDLDPIDGQRLSAIFSALYEIPSQLVAQIKEIVVPQN